MVYRLYVEKKEGFRTRESALAAEIREFLGVSGLSGIRIVKRYDVQGIDRELFGRCRQTVFSEVPVDRVYDTLTVPDGTVAFAVAYLPGQFDQRSDSCSQCIQLIGGGERPLVQSATVYLLQGTVSDAELASIKRYLVNPVESMEVSLDPVDDLSVHPDPPKPVSVLRGFIGLGDDELADRYPTMDLAMDIEDLKMVRSYFRSLHRDPTETEIRVIDTYWSDHCRHTTFCTTIDSAVFEDERIEASYRKYLALRKKLGITKPVSLMDLATIGAKALKKAGAMDRLDESDEINACSVNITVDHDGVAEPWLLLFKNETHNHPTEIEPFGGAATCIGGAIRDPLSGRGYVYQAMRISGSGNPLTPLAETMEGKLPQHKIAVTAASGNSSYGNQIGLATGLVDELYHPGFVAKHLELGAVVGAVKKDHVRRLVPEPGDKVVLVGGRTGMDGCGGATGSSKSHDLQSLQRCSAEVQKGNAPEERKLQRLFRRKEASVLVKRCNDFGAGGVSVAVGELADGLEIDLDAIPVKYEGMDGTSLAISESQERMAVVLSEQDVERFRALADEENLEATVIATVTERDHLVMYHQNKVIVDIDRSFLDTNGAEKHASVWVGHRDRRESVAAAGMEQRFLDLAADLNVCSKQGLAERFDSTIGAGTVLMPFGGSRQKTPSQVMAALIPVENGSTTTCSAMSWGYDPYRMEEDPYSGAFDSVCHSIAKLAASGADLEDVYLSFQEYFCKLQDDPLRWGLPFSALLGALEAQLLFKKGAIGGKDSMSGSFEDLDVPPTLVSFAIACTDSGRIAGPEFKDPGHRVVLLEADEEAGMPALFDKVASLVQEKRILACYAVGFGGIAEALFKMGLGNRIGVTLDATPDLFCKRYGSFVAELADEDLGIGIPLGKTCAEYRISGPGFSVDMEAIEERYEGTLEPVYPRTVAKAKGGAAETRSFVPKTSGKKGPSLHARPKVLVPVFPGTNCEYDTKRAMEDAGALAEIFVVRNGDAAQVNESARLFAGKLADSQILFIPGGFSGGDEPDGSGKFIASFLRNPSIAEEITRLLDVRDGLACGICNGFQALVKLGLLPYGKITDLGEGDLTLTFNLLPRHQSMLVRTRTCTDRSPWLSRFEVGHVSLLPVSHGEGRFFCSETMRKTLVAQEQIATQYVDPDGNATMDLPWNPNGSVDAIEGLLSPDGRVFGRMAHSERFGSQLYKNTPYRPENGIFCGAVEYFA
jgi:phosphoribosylformylglycinamidine synthase